MRSATDAGLPLFDSAQRLDVLPLLKTALADAMKACPLSRAQIAEAMNDAMRREGLQSSLSEETINKWCSPSDSTHHPTLRQLPFLIAVIHDTAPLNVLLQPFKACVAGPYEATLIEEGMAREAEAEAKRAAKEARMRREIYKRERRR